MSNEQKEIKMTQAEKITNLIEIANKLTTRCLKIEKDSIQQIFALEKRIAHLENKRDKEQESHDNNTSYKTYENEDDMLNDLSRPWRK